MPLIGTGVVALWSDESRWFVVIASWAFAAELIGKGLAMDIGKEQCARIRSELVLIATDVGEKWYVACALLKQGTTAR